MKFGTQHSSGSKSRSSRGHAGSQGGDTIWLLVWIIIVLAATLFPFNFQRNSGWPVESKPPA